MLINDLFLSITVKNHSLLCGKSQFLSVKFCFIHLCVNILSTHPAFSVKLLTRLCFELFPRMQEKREICPMKQQTLSLSLSYFHHEKDRKTGEVRHTFFLQHHGFANCSGSSQWIQDLFVPQLSKMVLRLVLAHNWHTA